MNRRSFLGLLGLGLAAPVVKRVWPFRTYSFAPARRLWIPDPSRIDLINLDAWGKMPWKEYPFYMHPEQFKVYEELIKWSEMVTGVLPGSCRVLA